MKIRVLISLAAVVPLAACGRDRAARPQAQQKEVVVFAAASLRESLQELADGYQRQTGTRVTFNFAGSNDLAHQIAAARGMDLFVSASEAWMDTVQNRGRLVDGTRRDLLSNTLVVVASTHSTARMDGPCALATLPFKHIATGDPQAVPAGIYAKKWLGGVRCGGRPLWDAVAPRIAPTPDVRSAIGLVAADPEVAGLVYRTDQLAFAGRTRVLYEVKDGPPIRYAVAQIAEGANPDGARVFLGFLSGPEAAQVFAKHGFVRVTAQTAAKP
ncbi:MAG TPA: molybdate ABC transporter substrate-binding protein [Longimicrobiaceae bacterium]